MKKENLYRMKYMVREMIYECHQFIASEDDFNNDWHFCIYDAIAQLEDAESDLSFAIRGWEKSHNEGGNIEC